MKKKILTVLSLGVLAVPFFAFAIEVLDTDGDSISDGVDNCLTVPNFDQIDSNENGIGDACDNAPENTLLLCTDSLDNDQNGVADIADDSCVLFRPTINFTKILNNNEQGTKQFGDFSFHWIVGDIGDDFTAPLGTRALTFPFAGAFSVTEQPVEGYTTTIGSGCTGVLSINTNADCVITNDYNGSTSGGEGTDTPPVVPPVTPSTPASAGGSSSFDYYGCTNVNALNYNRLANKDDGSCTNTVSVSGGTSGGTTDGGNVGSTTTSGEVLGASTTDAELPLPPGCSAYINSYMRKWKKNDVDDVKRLQVFLNETMGTSIPETGDFGPKTKSAVVAFQKKYHDEIIKPWVDAGFGGKDIENGTGYVFKTTKRWINIMKCDSLRAEPMPVLVPDMWMNS